MTARKRRGVRWWLVALVVVVAAALGWFGLSVHHHRVHREVFVPVPPKLVWPVLLDAVRDSHSSAYWPSEYQTLSASVVAEGALVEAVYHTPLGGSVHRYEIVDFDPPEGFQLVAAPGEDGVGGGMLRLLPVEGGTVVWLCIDYAYRGFSPSGLYMRLFFFEPYFDAIEAGLLSIGR